MTKCKKRLGLRVPNNLYEKLLDKANRKGKTINSVCLEVFWYYFENNESKDLRP